MSYAHSLRLMPDNLPLCATCSVSVARGPSSTVSTKQQDRHSLAANIPLNVSGKTSATAAGVYHDAMIVAPSVVRRVDRESSCLYVVPAASTQNSEQPTESEDNEEDASFFDADDTPVIASQEGM